MLKSNPATCVIVKSSSQSGSPCFLTGSCPSTDFKSTLPEAKMHLFRCRFLFKYSAGRAPCRVTLRTSQTWRIAPEDLFLKAFRLQRREANASGGLGERVTATLLSKGCVWGKPPNPLHSVPLSSYFPGNIYLLPGVFLLLHPCTCCLAIWFPSALTHCLAT